MEDLVVLVIFALIIIFNFILKKVAGKAQSDTGDGNAEREHTGSRNYSQPDEEIRAFLDEIKTQAQKTKAASKQAPPKSASQQSGASPQQVADRTNQLRPKKTRPAPSLQDERQPESELLRENQAGDDKRDFLAETHIKRPPSAPGISQHGRGAFPHPSRSSLKKRVGTNRDELRKAVIMSEILGKPVGMRGL